MVSPDTARNGPPRTLARTAAGTFDARRAGHAFTRGDAAEGWNQSTDLTRRERRQALAALDRRAAEATARRVAHVQR